MTQHTYIGCIICTEEKKPVMSKSDHEHLWTEIKVVEGWNT